MTIAFWCVLIAIFLPYVCTSIAKFGGEGYGGRANADRGRSSVRSKAFAGVPTTPS